jgi:translation initiation factor IF-2
MEEIKIGVVTHYFGKAMVAGIDITDGELKVGDTIHIKGHSSDFTQTISSMQIEHQSVPVATKGQSIGIKVAEPAREHDAVYKVIAP